MKSSILSISKHLFSKFIQNIDYYSFATRRLQYLLDLTRLLCLSTFDDLAMTIDDTMVIYVIVTVSKLYIGQTKHFPQRQYEHINKVRDIITNNCPFKYKHQSNKALYKYLAYNNFVIIPILRINAADCLSFESTLIRTFGTQTLNIDTSERTTPIPNIISTSNILSTKKKIKKIRRKKSKNKHKQDTNRTKDDKLANTNNANIQKGRKSAVLSHIYRPTLVESAAGLLTCDACREHAESMQRVHVACTTSACTHHGWGPYNPSVIIPALFIVDNIIYTSPLSLLNAHIDSTINVIFCPPTAALNKTKLPFHLRLCKFSYHMSVVTLNNTTGGLSLLLDDISSTTSRISFSIKVVHTNTLTENIFLLINRNCHRKIDYLMSTMNEMIASHLSVFFWMRLFRTANAFNNAKTTIIIRKFLKHYIFFTYTIPTNEITDGLSLNIVLTYHPLINKQMLSQCHKHIITCFTQNYHMLQSTYTTLKKHKPIRSLLPSQKHFLQHFHKDMSLVCSCGVSSSRHGAHKITMPYDMSATDEDVIRNLDIPIINNTNFTLYQTTLVFCKLIQKLSLTLKTPTPPTVVSTINFTLNNNDITISLSSRLFTFAVPTTVFTCFLLLARFTTLTTHEHLCLCAIQYFTAAPGASTNTAGILLKIILDKLARSADGSFPDCKEFRALFLYLKNNGCSFSMSNKSPLYHDMNTNTPSYVFVLHHSLLVNGVKTTNIANIISVFTSIISNNTILRNQHDTNNPSKNLTSLRDKYANAVWVSIDKDARRMTPICQYRLYDEIMNCFVNDTKHFKIISDDGFDDSLLVKKVLNKMDKSWLKHTWRSKEKLLAYLYVTIKLDGVRVRPIGSYCKIPQKRLFGLVATALFNVLKFSGLKHFTMFDSNSLKESVMQFDTKISNKNWKIHKDTFDLKNFYTEVQKAHLLHRLQFTKSAFKKHNRTNLISVPKKKNKKVSAHPGPDMSYNFINFSIDTLIDIVSFALDNTYFRLGHYILQQIDGLPMGDPMSPPLAFIYVAYDEHEFLRSKPLNYLHIELLLLRYADDILRLIAMEQLNSYTVFAVDYYLTNNLYEHDIVPKNLILEQDHCASNKFLDSDIIIHNNSSNVKITYHNKNANISSTSHQNVGRLYSFYDAMHIKMKINAFATLMIRAYDFTTYTHDCFLPLSTILSEMSFLLFSPYHMRSALMMCNRTRPSDVWMKMFDIMCVGYGVDEGAHVWRP